MIISEYGLWDLPQTGRSLPERLVKTEVYNKKRKGIRGLINFLLKLKVRVVWLEFITLCSSCRHLVPRWKKFRDHCQFKESHDQNDFDDDLSTWPRCLKQSPFDQGNREDILAWQCYVLIRQSDSLGPYQVQVGCWVWQSYRSGPNINHGINLSLLKRGFILCSPISYVLHMVQFSPASYG